jgi:hypothetical protein
MKLHVVGIDLGKTVSSSGTGLNRKGGDSQVMFSSAAAGLDREFRSAVDRHGVR